MDLNGGHPRVAPSLDVVVQRVSYRPPLLAPGRRALSPCYRVKQRKGI